MEIKQKKRSEIPDKYKWNLEDIFKTEADWRKAVETVKVSIEDFEKFEGTLTTGAAIFNCLEKMYDTLELNNLVYLYGNLKQREDTTVSEFQAMEDIASSTDTEFEAAISFVEPEILEHDEKTIRQFITTTPGLKKYEHYLNDLLRKKAHVLSAEMEELLANAEEIGEAPSNIYDVLESGDLKFGSITDENGNTVEVTYARYGTLIRSANRRVRKDTFEAYNDAFGKLKNTFATLFSSSVKKDIFFAKTRKYTSTLDASLYESNIPRTVYEKLIETVEEFLPVLHRYMNVRKKALKLDELHIYDRFVPLVDDIDTKIPYDKAAEMVIEGLAPLGKEYIAAMEKALENRWIDVYENEGKATGGFEWGMYGCHPYILLNYEDNIADMLTLAHELGHAMHDHYAYQTQPHVYADAPIFLAEVASTVNEVLMTEHLIKTTTCPKTRIYLLDQYIEQFRDNMFHQVMFAEFEKITHNMAEEGEPLTLDVLNDVFGGLYKKYYGPGMVIDERLHLSWATIPHFYRAFYVYQYSTGYAAALALATKLKSGCPQALEDYLGFLKSGSSNYPIEILKKAGVDMSTPEPVRETLQVFEGLVAEMEEIFA